jgi:hypothetical protein
MAMFRLYSAVFQHGELSSFIFPYQASDLPTDGTLSLPNSLYSRHPPHPNKHAQRYLPLPNLRMQVVRGKDPFIRRRRALPRWDRGGRTYSFQRAWEQSG